MKTIKEVLGRPWVRIAGSLLILGILLAFLPLHKLAAALRIIPLTVWGLVLAGFLVTHIVGVAKWRLTLHVCDAQLTFLQATRCYFAGLFGTLFLPSVVGGDVVRMGLAFRIERNRAGVVLGSLVDRLLDTTSLAVVAGAGVLLLPGALNAHHRRAFIELAAVFALAFAGLFTLLIFTPWRKLPFKVRRMSVKIRRAWRSMASRPQYVLVSFALGIIIQVSLLALSATIAKACGLHVAFRIWLLVWPLAKLLALVPLTLGGLGIREAGLVALLAPFGVAATLAVAAGLAWESIVIGGGLSAGLISFLIGGSAFARSVFQFERVRSSEELNSAA
ncbi:MAG: lysylphosphatidylglycerol synthase transmembrane domain-containing protein [Candidatus Korobacteraceae bacterium]